MRSVTPQLAGIYHYVGDITIIHNNTGYMSPDGLKFNRHWKKELKKYAYLLLPKNDPYEHYIVDAFPCDINGNIKPGYETAIPKHASDFGDFIKEIPTYED